MSRIHDALKRAEQEREAARAEGLLSKAELDRPVAEIAEPPRAEDPRAPISVDALLTHCARPTWKLAPKVAQVLSAGMASPGAEELRTLRSRLYQIRDRQPLRKVLITSALPGEGKTFLTVSLAHMIVRQHERRVLIIDADLRRSQLHETLGAPMSPGLTDYLADQADELSIIQRGRDAELYLIPGGKSVSNPAELLSNGRFTVLLERLTPVFDWILIDSPPVVPVHDSSILAGFCDGALMVVRAGSTPFELVQKARMELKEKGLLGVVLNQLEEGQTYQSYYYNHYGRNGSGSKKAK
jgi:capsular exopolysaccharide synthesis family protein